MKVLVCGGRDFKDRVMLWRVLDHLHELHRFTLVIHGVARGADALADHWAQANKIPVYRFHANWKQLGDAAGPIRNAKMLEKGKPELVIAFPGGKGTKDMMRKALAAKVAVKKVYKDGTIVPWIYPAELELDSSMVEVHRVEIVFGNVLKIMEVGDEDRARGQQLLTVKYEQFTITMEGDHAMYTLPVDHTVKMQVAYTDAKGNPATIDGAVSWQSSDTSVVMVQVDDTDSTKCRAVPVGSLGQVQVTATADADLGEGKRELITTCDIQIVGGEAVAGSIQPVGEPDPITPDNTLPGGQPHPDQSLPGPQPGIDNTLPGGRPDRVDNTLPGGGAEPKRR